MRDRPVPGSQETRQRILSAAKEEFSQKGFSGSSLRQICRRADVTTGALYFFFQGKDDLFYQVIEQVTVPFLQLMQDHYQQEAADPCREKPDGLEADFWISRQLIRLYFADPVTWDILRNHLNHPAVSEFLKTFTEVSSAHYLFLLSHFPAASTPSGRLAVHQFVRMQADTMLDLISHNLTQEEMVLQGRIATRMLRAAFQTLLTQDDMASL